MRKNLLILLSVVLVCFTQVKAQCDDIDFGCSNFDLVVDLAVDTAGLLNLCEGEPITFLNQTTDNLDAIDSFVWIFNYLGADLVGSDCEIANSTDPVTYNYNFNDTLICTNPNVNYVLLSVGLSAIDTNGCFSLVQSNEIVINILPRALFTVSTSACTNQDVNIVNISCPNSANIEFEWESQPDGQTSTDENPDFVYPLPGTYTITLTAISDTCNFEDEYVQSITILEPPEPSYAIGSANIDSLCASIDTLILVDQTIGTDSTLWQVNPSAGVSFVDGDNSGDTVYVVFDNDGTYNVTLIGVNEACSRDTSFSIDIFPVGLLNVNNLPDCVDTSVIDLNDYTGFNGTPDSYEITVTYLEDGSQQIYTNVIPSSVTLSDYGNYEVTVVSTTDCGEVSRTGLFGFFPPISLLPVDDLCFNQDTFINLNDLIVPQLDVCFTWNGAAVIDDSLFNPSIIGEGSYFPILRDCENLCINEGAPINVLNETIDLESFFICISTDPSSLDDIEEGQWSGPLVINDTLYPDLAGVGIFEIYYESDLSTTCRIRDTIEVEVKPAVIVDFSVNAPNCVDSIFQFVNQSSDSIFIWDFGDGFLSNLENPAHQYISGGTYEVLLVAGDPVNGCVDSIVKSILVQELPNVGFIVIEDSISCDSVDLIFIANIYDSLSTYVWDINGDTILYGDSVNYTQQVFDTISQIMVELTVTNTCGAVSNNQLVNLSPGFFVDLIYDSEAIRCAGDTVDFLMIDNSVDSFIIDYGNGVISINEVLDVPYANNSDSIVDYLVTIYGYNEVCGWDTASVIVPILNGVPVASALYSDGSVCVGEPIQFYNNSEFESEAVIFFGDSNSAIFTSDTIIYQYSNAGDYVPFVVAYGCGIDTNYLDPITIAPLPDFNIEVEPREPCVDGEVTLINVGNNISPVWILNEDTAASFIDTFRFTPTAPGDYVVVLSASATGGSFCTTTDTVTIAVGAAINLAVNVLPTDGCAPLEVVLDATSTDPSTMYDIDFGNQQISQSNMATTIYNTGGDYTINVTTMNDEGCMEDTSIQVTVLDAFDVQAIGDTTILIGEAVELDFTTNQSFVDFNWYVDGTLLGSNTVRPLIDYPTEDAIYNIEVYGIDSSCVGIDSVLVRVECDEIFLPDAFSPNGDGINDNYNVFRIFTDYDENDGLSCIELLDVSIFDRWGELIFYSESIEDYWDGTYKGKALNAGIFSAVVNYKVRELSKSFKKQIHLIK